MEKYWQWLGSILVFTIAGVFGAVFLYYEIIEPCAEIEDPVAKAQITLDSRATTCGYLLASGSTGTLMASWQEFLDTISVINKPKWPKGPDGHADLAINEARALSLLPTKLKQVANRNPLPRILELNPRSAASTVRLMETAQKFARKKTFHLIAISSWMSEPYISKNGTLKRVEIYDGYEDYIMELKSHNLLNTVFPIRLPPAHGARVIECSGASFHILYVGARNLAELTVALELFPIFLEERSYVIGELAEQLPEWGEMNACIQRFASAQGGLEQDGQFWAVQMRNLII